MPEILLQIWNFQYALVPCLAAYLVFDFATIVRRVTRKAYVPIYFMFFPYGYTDELYAQYFDEDTFLILGPPLTDEEKIYTRKKIIWLSMVSLIFSVLISPMMAGLFGYFVLNDYQFTQFMWTLFIVKLFLLARSLYDLKHVWVVGEAVSLYSIALIYALYLVAILINTHSAYEWVASHYSVGGINNMIWSFGRLLVQDFGITILGAAVFGWLIPWRITSVEVERD